MKNRNIFYIVYFSLLIFTVITIFILSILGNKTRVGYLSQFKFDEYHISRTLELNGLSKIKENYIISEKLDEESIKNFIFTNNNITNYSYGFKLQYYDKIFRNSDIYGVYVDTNKIINNNNFIKRINVDENGSPFGNMITYRIINNKIDNIEYTLKLKKYFVIWIIIIYVMILFTYSVYVNAYKYKLYIIFIILLAIFVRLFWAYQQDGMYWDEYHSLTYLNKGESDNSGKIKNYIIKKGYYILKDLTIDNSSIKDCFDDIKRLYKNTNDPFISNLYYSLLRLSFIGREAVDIKNIIMTGTILNCIFFILSFIFLYKILKLIFEYKYDCILFSLLIMSLSPISISFSMFLRPYQMQETFFIVIIYLVIDTIYNNKYSLKNLIITSIIAGIGYLTLYSSMLFVLILSAMLFINYIVKYLKFAEKVNIFNTLIKIESYKIILYYASAFISALFVSRLLYASFFSSLFNANNRASNSLKFSGKLFDYINNLSFDGLLSLIITYLSLMVIIYLFYLKKNNKNFFINIKKDKFKLLIFIIILGLLYAILGDFTSPFKLERYSAPSYILILFIFPLIFSIINNNKIKYIIFILISIVYIYNITNPKRFSYFEKIDKNKYVLTENLHVYTYKIFFNHYKYPYEYLNTNLYYTYIDNENDLNIITNGSKFYFLINDETKYILTNKLLKEYKIYHLDTMNSISILKLEKK